ncbi:hypothetical protein HYH02_013129 [Chlamydomonas schloesseri]|uniref:Endonuclease/exonuclease/phosphatase domain-containing protein n=1 Tax=Chlamydomonas schloesseri TaxID=2026947 RepID=A0A835SUH0_9CHLO|nr:hypothetical protein HYH02_013129 [Chlamydomonas schloesseri]|eukprot:KAG2432061.1 hypothetical protein HYH02_013129 [Chlamydomonas schloesseri]
MTEPIDLTEDNEPGPYVAPSRKRTQSRSTISALAAGLNETLHVAEATSGPRAKRQRTATATGLDLPGPAPRQQQQQQPNAQPAFEGELARKPAAPTQAPDTNASTPEPAQPAPAGLPLSAQLHQERLRRMGKDAEARMRVADPPAGQAPTAAQSVPSGASPRKAQEAARGSFTAAATAAGGRPAQASGPAAAAARPAAAAGPWTGAGSAYGAANRSAGPASTSTGFPQNRPVSILTWNLWFDEEMELVARMKAVGDIIEREGHPDLLLFQEVTHNMVLLFSQTAWYRRYHCSPLPREQPYFTLVLARRDTVTLTALQPWANKDYENSVMGRGILYTRVAVGGRPLVVGTTHLESPVGRGPQQMTAQRREQLGTALKELQAAAGPTTDCVLAGDLNWSDSRDGAVPLPPRWVDAWRELRPGQPGNTYDCQANPMLTGRWPGSRLDRLLCRLGGMSGSGGGSGGGGGGWKLDSIKMLGTEALPGLTAMNKGTRVLVLPSDHFGLLLKLVPMEAEAGGSGRSGGYVLGSGPAAGPAAAGPAAAAAALDAAGTVAASPPKRASVSKAGGSDGPGVAAAGRRQAQAKAPAAGGGSGSAAPPQRPAAADVTDLTAEGDEDPEVIIL